MPRYKLVIEYDGTPFVGWQVQDVGPSVQGALATAIEAFCGERVEVRGAGRTDAGVHALGQVAHVDLAKDWDADTVRDAVTAHLRPHPIAVRIGPDATAGDLHDELARRGADLMVRALAALERGALVLTPQPEAGVTTAAKIDKAETRIDWTQPWQRVHDHIRGLSPFPGAWCEIVEGGKPVRVKVLRTTRGEGSGVPGTLLDGQFTIACGEGAVRVLQLQRAGRQAMTADEFLRGTPISRGARLS